MIAEVDECCLDLIRLIDSTLLPGAREADARLYYEKLKADYWRYIAENKEGEEKEQAAEEARKCYEAALAEAEGVRNRAQGLGVILNYSVFLYEIVGEKEAAIELAKKTQEEWAGVIQGSNEEAFAESTNVLQLLRENVELWSKGTQ
jgi:14-3-3 protein epsilon